MWFRLKSAKVVSQAAKQSLERLRVINAFPGRDHTVMHSATAIAGWWKRSIDK